jgi:hypothetical protein
LARELVFLMLVFKKTDVVIIEEVCGSDEGDERVGEEQ